MNYKYQLRKGGHKEVCPACGKRRFVPYVLSEDNKTIIDPTWGRCDREQSCGYWVKPNGSNGGSICVSSANVNAAEPIRWLSIIGNAKPEANSLFYFASWLVGEYKARGAFERYRVTSTYADWCTFWQISLDGTIRAGKAIRYVNGHRDKQAVPPVRWLHADHRFDLYRVGEELRQCFFGEHLLVDGCKVAVVESEKTALLMSAIRPEFVWLASGGSCCLKNADKNKVLSGRDVTLFPDNGQYVQWRAIALPKGWAIDDTCLKVRDGFGAGYDLLDLYERWLYEEEERRHDEAEAYISRGGER